MANQNLDQDDVAATRRQIVVRGAVVAGLIVVLLAGLLIFERENAPAPAPENKPAGRAISPIGNVVTSSAPALPEEISRAVREAPDVTQAALATMSAPAAVPEETFDPTVPREGEPAPPVPTAAASQAANPVRRAPPVSAAPAGHGNDKLLVEGAKPGQSPSVSAKPAAAPPQAPAAALAAPVAPATPSPSGYLIQLGVFNNRGNAEELRSRLALAGIPSQVETRVQLGPFKTRDEALKAQQTLKKLGLAQGLLVPPRKP